mmetsp:Transcript_90913/g.256804  ORF Transcript_90913/g.256804 Transcript_90913/m.256804 type:complete len:122 (+) Transcript_90913:198-563(+)
MDEEDDEPPVIASSSQKAEFLCSGGNSEPLHSAVGDIPVDAFPVANQRGVSKRRIFGRGQALPLRAGCRADDRQNGFFEVGTLEETTDVEKEWIGREVSTVPVSSEASSVHHVVQLGNSRT